MVGPEDPLDTQANPGGTKPKSKSRPKPRPKRKRPGKPFEKRKENGQRLWTFPKNSLEDAIRIAKAIEEKNAGNPMPAKDLATAVGFRQPQDWRFLDLVRSANQYGLVTGSGPTSSVSLTSLGQDVIAPSSPSQRTKGLLNAFRTVKTFADVESFYGGKPIPEDEFFLNTVTREFGVQKDRVETFAKIFRDNLAYLRAFTTSVTVFSDDVVVSSTDSSPLPTPTADQSIRVVLSKEPKSREFLDTCFVMMPFGEWFDKYYQDIYAPAIKEAGFEPVRADELFTTGSVVEQIWDQIEKGRLLLADLTGKNPNVFYELGLAHAAGKPVIFTAANVDDVPFDLRHLRVIIYDIREPEWASKLRTSVTDYLRNAAKDPGKSIPHPFRGTVEGEDGGLVRLSRRN